MNADPIAVQNLFAQAVAIADPKERQAFVREQCADDAELLRRVEVLLAAYDEPKPFFDQPTAQLGNLPASAAYQSTDAAQRPGSVVAGRYKLLEAIGEGGMGTVWVAEQTSPVRRKVALKLVKPGMDSRQVLARFDAERQALALMDHPNIAKVFDGGVTEQGRPFFAMEYVKGMPLTEYCDQTRLSLKERLKLFIPICQAVQHAHQKGIIHRDLKPSNVLICLYDGKPVPKVIDFGLAKAMYQPLTEHTLHTGHGLMIGTPLYMSPEQAEHNNLDVDTRTDIYSLGVMLYELLTGTTPLERAQFKEAAFGEILRLIKEVEPPKPSTRVSTNAQRASIAAQRSLESEQLGRSIRGDLDWIVMKALDKERDRRYESANGLARDLERFLNQEAVEACPPSTVYRLRKQFQKHRAAISTAAAFLLLLCAGAVVSTWQAYRAIKAERIAITAEATARQERDKALENESQAMAARTAESDARMAEERARLAESQQRAEAESQRVEAVKQRDEAQRLQQEAVARSTQLQQLTEEQRRAIYASDMNLVRIEAQRGNLQRMREILYQQLPIDHSDLRGFEWYYWYRYLNQALVVRHIDLPRRNDEYSRPVVLPGGKLAAVPKGSETMLVELDTGKEMATFPRAIGQWVVPSLRRALFPKLEDMQIEMLQMFGWYARARFAENGRCIFGEYDPKNAFGGISMQSVNSSHNQPQGDTLPSGFTIYAKGHEPIEFRYPTDSFSHISFLNISQDGRFVGALGNDKRHTLEEPISRLVVWNADTQEVVFDQVQMRRLNHFVFNHDGSRIAAYYCLGPDFNLNEIRDVLVAWDVTEGKELGVARHDDDIETAIWLPNADRLLVTTNGMSGRQEKELLAWDIASYQLQRFSSELIPNHVQTCISPDGKMVALGSLGNDSIRLIDAVTGRLKRTLHNEAFGIESFAFNSDGTQLTAFGESGDVVKWPTLNLDQNRFAIRSRSFPYTPNPIKERVASEMLGAKFDFSDDGELVAYYPGQFPGSFLSIRTAEGNESYYADVPTSVKPFKLRFNSAANLLAATTRHDVQLMDVRKGVVRWQTPLDNGSGIKYVREFDVTGGASLLEFTSDQSSLIATSIMGGVFGFDIETGSKREIVASTPQSSFFAYDLRKCGDDGQLLVVGLASTQTNSGVARAIETRDAVTGERLYSVPFDLSKYKGLWPHKPICISPSGKKLIRVFNDIVELWDLSNSRLVFRKNGSYASFSPDGQQIVVTHAGRSTPRPKMLLTVMSWTPTAERVEIVSSEDGRLFIELSLAGDEADEIRFSPDGRRLLTLHGKFPNDAVSRPAHARLWDCESGREILDLSVASDRVFHWDLKFDSTGNLLTGGVLGRALSGGNREADERSLRFDATPLSPQEDVQLIASYWVNQLKQQTPIPKQMIETIQKNKLCAARVRDVALEMVGRIVFDSELVTNQCLAIVEQPDSDTSSYQRALSWAKALEQVDQASLRTIAMVGAAQLRLGQIDEALATLRQRKPIQLTSDHQDFRWEQLRRSMEVLGLYNQGKDPIAAHRCAIGLADFVHDAHAGDTNTTGIQWLPTSQEALLTQGTDFASSQISNRVKSGGKPTVVYLSSTFISALEKQFRSLDTNGDGILSASERASFQVEITDIDEVAGISYAEWRANLLIMHIRNNAKGQVQSKQKTNSNAFLAADRNKDGRVTPDEWGASTWNSLKAFDQDQDDALTFEEYEKYLFQKEFVGWLLSALTGKDQPTSEIQLLTLNLAINEIAEDPRLLTLRALLRATSPDEMIRNGEQALQDATQACQITKYLNAVAISALAAAYAESDDFDKAVKYGEKAMAMIGPTGTGSDRLKAMLDSYNQKQAYRRHTIDSVEINARNDPSRQPLFTADQIQKAQRIPGGEPCWSSDGKHLIYALTAFAATKSYLESLDLTTGEKKILCKGGRFIVCSPADNSLAFIRRPLRSEPTELWLYDPVSNTESKLTNGIPYCWTNDGMLCYRPWRSEQAVCVDPKQLDKPIWTLRGARSPERNAAVSPDGKRYAQSSFGKWSIFDLQQTLEMPPASYDSTDTGRADWSADGRWIAHSTHIDDEYGVWLIDTHTQQTRLLAELAAYPRWSPDGKTLALGLQSSNEIVLLDVSSLDTLWKENHAETPKQP